MSAASAEALALAAASMTDDLEEDERFELALEWTEGFGDDGRGGLASGSRSSLGLFFQSDSMLEFLRFSVVATAGCLFTVLF